MHKIKQFLFRNTSTNQTLVKNTFWLFVGEGISRTLKILLILIGARILGVQEWGIFSYGLSVALIFSFFADMGLHTIATREFSKKTKNQRLSYIASLIFLKYIILLLTYIFIIIFLGITTFILIPPMMVVWVAIFTIADSYKDFLFGIVRANEKMETEALIKIAANILTIIAGMTVLYTLHSATSFIAAYACGSIFAILLLLLTSSYKKSIIKYELPLIKKVFMDCIPFGLILFSTTILFNIDTVIIGWFQGSTGSGLYAAGQKLVQILYIIPYLISLALLPQMIKSSFSKSPLLNKIFAGILGFSLPIVIIGIIFASKITVVLFGLPFISTAPIFAILLISIIAVFPLHLINNMIIANGKQWQYIRVHLIAVILDISLILIGTHYFGMIGTAIGTTISLLILTISGWNIADLDTRQIVLYLRPYIIAAVSMLGVIIVLNIILPITIAGAISIPFYLFILIRLREPFLSKAFISMCRVS